MGICKKLAIVAALGTLCTASVQGGTLADMENFFVPTPVSPGGGTGYVIVFQGNVINDINLGVTANDPLINPFEYVQQQFFGGVGRASVDATLDGNGNTVLVYSGPNPYLPQYTTPGQTSSNGFPHFGYDPSTPYANILASYWLPDHNAMPMFSVAGPTATGTNLQYVVFYAAATTNGLTVGQWFELPYNPGQSPSLIITNYTTTTESLSDVGYFLSSTQIPLDDLNWPSAPPTGQPGSPFIALPQFNGMVLGAGDGLGTPGGSFATGALPEPSSVILLASGLLATAGGYFRGRKRK